MGFPATNDLFQHRYYRINRMVLKLTGLWPYQSTRTRSIVVALVLLIGATQIIPLMLRLLNHMRADWDSLAGDRDVNILHEYANTGRKLTIAYTVVAFTTCFLFATQPIVPKIVDVFLKNGTEPGQFPIPVDYLIIDAQKYYFYIILHFFATVSTAFICVVAHDSLYMVYIQHGCGLYETLGRKFERIGRIEKSVRRCEIAYVSDEPGMDIKYLTFCIDRHNEAIKYAELIEANYSWCFFFIMGFNIFLITVTGLQIVTLMEPQDTLRFVIGNIIAMAHLYVECYMAQILMDHSIILNYYILNSEWYKLPLKAQKFLLLSILRCNKPCKITAGGVFVLYVETFTMVLKTSISYLTVLRSI